MKIEITQEDIKAGTAGDRCQCPIARAVNRACGLRANVLYTWLSVGNSEFRLPKKARLFIKRFDEIDNYKRKHARPFSFNLPI